MKISLVAAALIVLATGACSSPSPQPKPVTSSTSRTSAPVATTTSAEAALAKFEAENQIPTSSWAPMVTGREVQMGSSLWVYTKLSTTESARELAARICGAYAQYVLVDPKVVTTYVRAADGTRLAKCGPGY